MVLFKEISILEIQSAREALCLLDPLFFKVCAVVPSANWPTREKGFCGLVRLIVGQQVSIASANAIWQRFETGLGLVNAEQVLTKTIEDLKSYGLSTSKAHYVHGIAKAHQNGEINFDAFIHLDDATTIAKLMELKGVGRWTAESYLMWCESRTDCISCGRYCLTRSGQNS